MPMSTGEATQGGVKRLLFGCERQKSEFFVLPTVGNGTRLGVFSSRRWHTLNAFLNKNSGLKGEIFFAPCRSN
jgi:hypothetical protein